MRIKSSGGSLADSAWQHPCQGSSTSVANVSYFIRRNTDDRQEFFNQAMARALNPIDSHANFVMMNTFHPAEEVIQHFRKNNILIGRPFPPMDTHIRISLGRPEEMRAFWQTWDLLPYPKHSMQH